VCCLEQRRFGTANKVFRWATRSAARPPHDRGNARRRRSVRGRELGAGDRDAYQEELQRIIDAKIAGEEVTAPVEETPPKVVNLMVEIAKAVKGESPKAVAKEPKEKKRARG